MAKDKSIYGVIKALADPLAFIFETPAVCHMLVELAVALPKMAESNAPFCPGCQRMQGEDFRPHRDDCWFRDLLSACGVDEANIPKVRRASPDNHCEICAPQSHRIEGARCEKHAELVTPGRR